MQSNVEINQSFFETLFTDLLTHRKSFKEKYSDLFYRNHCDLLLLLVSKNKVKRHFVTENYLVIETRSRVIVVGYDQENKLLFTNVLNDYIPNHSLTIEDIERILLGYSESALSDSYVVTTYDKWKVIRIQGDLVLMVDNVYDNYSEMFESYLRRLLLSEVFGNSVIRYISFKIQQHLLKHRIHSTIRHHSVIIDRVLNPYTKYYLPKSEITRQIIINILQELPDIVREHIYTTYVTRLREHYYASIVIDIRPNEASELYRVIQSILEKELNGKFVELSTSIGNHEVYIDKALPLIIRVNYDSSEFTLTTQRIFVPSGSMMTVKHNEHRTKEIVFQTNAELILTTTNSSFDQNLLFNFVTFRNLISDYIKKNNIDLRKFFS